MRPASLLSAALCGVLWTSSSLIVNAVAQRAGEECTGLYRDGVLCTDSCSGCTTTSVQAGAGTPTDTNHVTLTTTFAVPVGSDGVSTVTSVATLPLETSVVTMTTPSYTIHTIVSTPSITITQPTVSLGAVMSVSESATVASNNALSSTTQASKASKANIGPIVGGVVGGVIVISLIGLGAFLFWRRRKSSPPRDEFGGLEKNRESSSPSVYPTPPPHAISYDAPSVPPQSATSGEAHALMSGYPETRPSGDVVPIVGAQKPYMAGATEREVDEDGVSLRCPSPSVPEEEGAEQGRDFVPRLPIYNRGSDETPRGPAL